MSGDYTTLSGWEHIDSAKAIASKLDNTGILSETLNDYMSESPTAELFLISKGDTKIAFYVFSPVIGDAEGIDASIDLICTLKEYHSESTFETIVASARNYDKQRIHDLEFVIDEHNFWILNYCKRFEIFPKIIKTDALIEEEEQAFFLMEKLESAKNLSYIVEVCYNTNEGLRLELITTRRGLHGILHRGYELIALSVIVRLESLEYSEILAEMIQIYAWERIQMVLSS